VPAPLDGDTGELGSLGQTERVVVASIADEREHNDITITDKERER
jgi:hypothetical protein